MGCIWDHLLSQPLSSNSSMSSCHLLYYQITPPVSGCFQVHCDLKMSACGAVFSLRSIKSPIVLSDIYHNHACCKQDVMGIILDNIGPWGRYIFYLGQLDLPTSGIWSILSSAISGSPDELSPQMPLFEIHCKYFK